MIDKIKKARQDKLEGKLNCIPFNLPRLGSIVPGIVKGSLDCITANSSVGKTTLAKKLYVYDAIDFAIKHNLDYRLIYFGLEESEEEFDFGLFSYLVHKTLNIRSNINDFQSFVEPYPQEHLDTIEKSNVQQLFMQYKSYITFYDYIYNSYGIYKTIRDYARSIGTFYNNDVELTATDFIDTNPPYTHFKPNNPNQFTSVIIDHVSELIPQKGETNLKAAIDNLVRYMRLYVTKMFNFNALCIQQQDSSQESVDNKKENYMEPKLQGLGDSKTTGRAYMNVFGLYNPIRYGVNTYEGYNTNKLDKYFRVMNIIKQRYGSVGEKVPLYFDGKVSDIRILPPANDAANLDKVYKKINNL
jgi:hypothetical protein